MRGIKILFGTTALLAGLALAPAAQAQLVVNIGVQPSCAVRLLRLCAIRLLALWLLRAGVLLQRHLPGHGTLGRLGLWPRLGRPSLYRAMAEEATTAGLARRAYRSSSDKRRRRTSSAATLRSLVAAGRVPAQASRRLTPMLCSKASSHGSAPASRAAASHSNGSGADLTVVVRT